MRLTCPNCGAQYEVDDDAIPESGRDVQCSNCGHVWYERPGAADDPAEMAEPDGWDDADRDTATQAPDDDDVDAPGGEAAGDTDSDRVAAPRAEDDADADCADDAEPEDVDEAAAPETAHPAAGPRRIAPDVERILREEAERERSARAAEEQPADDRVEDRADDDGGSGDAEPDAGTTAAAGDDAGDVSGTEAAAADGWTGEQDRAEEDGRAPDDDHDRDDQDDDDYGDDDAHARPPAAAATAETDADREAVEAARNLARLKGEEATVIGGPLHDPGVETGRRGQLPDIEEINSSLGSAEESAPDGGTGRPGGRGSGFRTGFGVVCLAALALALLYVGADTVSGTFPGLEPTMTAYRDMVDGWRLWLDMRVQGMIGGGAG